MNTTLTPFERHLGDLDHPWYHDERTRFVSYEIYTVTAQAMMFLGALLLIGMGWSGNRTVALWGCGVLTVLYLPMLYASVRIKRAVDPQQLRFRFDLRVALFLVLYAAGLLGLTQTLGGGGHSVSAAMHSGLIPGFVTGSVVTLALGWWKTRQATRNQPDPAQIPDED